MRLTQIEHSSAMQERRIPPLFRLSGSARLAATQPASRHVKIGEIMQQNRRAFLKAAGISGAAAALSATAARAENCPLGPPPHTEGPHVWMNMDQTELDAAYDQSVRAPLLRQILKPYASSSEQVRARLGDPKRMNYGPTPVEALDIFMTKKPDAPIF